MTAPISLSERLEAARAKVNSAPRPPTIPTAPVVPKVKTPPVAFMADNKSSGDSAIDVMIDSLDIIDAYNRYAHKGVASANGKTEGIMISCPNPSHPDKNPSAWINTDKQTWFCPGCAEGGDKFDIAAWHFGAPVPGYKVGKNFHDLRRKIAEDHGFTFQKTLGGVVTIPPARPAVDTLEVEDDNGVKLTIVRESEPIKAPSDTNIVALPIGPLSALEELEDIELKWRTIIPKDTFLDTWMKLTTIDDVPEEYHFWNGLLAISMSLGRDVTLKDYRPVYGNLFICILGRTGSGKSKAKYYLDTLLESALPYDATDPFSKGVLRTSGIASAEALIWQFQKEVEDPTDPKRAKPALYPVRGIVDYNELASMVGRTQRAGNVLMPTLMQFYDMENTVETVSRTHGVEKAVQPYACAVTTSQPKALRGLLTTTDAASGFLNRWFFAAGKEKERDAIGGVQVDIRPAIKPLADIQGWASFAGALEWSQEANDRFTAFFHTELQPIMKQDETDLLNRMDLLCKKLVLLFSANMKSKDVPVEAVDQMMKVYPYLLECYGIPGAHIGSSLQNEVRESILKVVIDHQTKTGKGATSRDITRRLARRKYPLDLYNRTMKYMIEIEELITMPAETGAGRPTIRYGVVDLSEWKSDRPADAPLRAVSL